MDNVLTCDVCRKPAVGSACSSTGPVTFAYCAECLRANREPYSALVASMVGMKSLDQAAEWYRPIILSNLKAEGKTLEEFFGDTQRAREEQEEEGRNAKMLERGKLDLFHEGG